MTRLIMATAVTLVLTITNAHAKCDAQKAARNAAMDATIGVSGRCLQLVCPRSFPELGA